LKYIFTEGVRRCHQTLKRVNGTKKNNLKTPYLNGFHIVSVISAMFISTTKHSQFKAILGYKKHETSSFDRNPSRIFGLDEACKLDRKKV